MDEANSYEEQRRRQIEQNKRKLDELRVHRLSAAVRQAAAKPMPVSQIHSPPGQNVLPSLPPCLVADQRLVRLLPQAKLLMPRNPRLDAPTRRSGRIASLPEQPDYRIRKANGDVKTESPDPVPVYATNEERAYAVAKAEQLKAQLGSDHPAFIKHMSHSSATKSAALVWQHSLLVCCNAICSWMVLGVICWAIWQAIPVHFNQYLPVHDEVMALVDEVNKEFDMLYHAT
jgi:hypothetical protein